jgi:hypothetical protein
MLSLDSGRWKDLEHAYGSARDIPPLLRLLLEFPPHTGDEAEPYFSLWSALCHQGDVYTASYAAVPHIVHALASNPARAHWDYFLLPTAIEIARSHGNGPAIPPELASDYRAALVALPELAARAATRELDELYCRVLAAAVVTAKGQQKLGEAILELTPEVLPKFMDWLYEQ